MSTVVLVALCCGGGAVREVSEVVRLNKGRAFIGKVRLDEEERRLDGYLLLRWCRNRFSW